MAQLSDLISQINSLTGYNVPTASAVVLSASAEPLSSGSVNTIIDYINSLTGYNIPASNVSYVSGGNVAGPVIIYAPQATGGTIPTEGIYPGAIIRSDHVLRIINALNGVNEDIIIISGSLLTSGSNVFNGSLSLPFISDGKVLYTSGGFVIGVDSFPSASYAATASYFTGSISNAISASYANTASFVTSASYALTASYVNPLYQDVQLTGSFLVTQSHLSSIDYIDFTVNPPGPPTHTEGRAHWDVDRKTLQLDTEINNFMIPVGHMTVIRGKNTSGDILTKGTVIQVIGNSGQFATFGTASWIDEQDSAYTLGIIGEDINPNNSGYAVTNGEIVGINTNAYPPATLLYLSSSGQFTSQKPVAPYQGVRLGQVIVQSTNGTINVKIDNGYETDELHDVLLISGSTGDLFVRSGSLWINSKQLTGSYGLTGSLQATSFTGSLLGTSSFALTASYALNAGGGNFAGNQIATGSISASVDLGAGSFTLTSASVNFLYVSSSGNVGINSTSPTSKLTVGGTGLFGPGNTDTGLSVGDTGLGRYIQLGYQNTAHPYASSAEAVGVVTGANIGAIYLKYKLGVSGEIRATTNLSVLPQNTSAGATLHIRGASNTTGFAALIQNSSSLDLLSLGNDGMIRMSGSVNVSGSTHTITGSVNVSGSATFASDPSTSALGGVKIDGPNGRIYLRGVGAVNPQNFIGNNNSIDFSTNVTTPAIQGAVGAFNSSISFTGLAMVLNTNGNGTISITNNRFGVYPGMINTGTGNWLIGSGSAGSYRLQVLGTTRLDGDTSISGSLHSVTGSLNAPNITGSLFGTASWAQNTLTASYYLTSSVTSASVATSASYAATASYAPAYLPLTGGTITGNVTINGTASIQYLTTIYETASVIFSSGSNQLGDKTDDVQTLIGTVIISGSQQITGSFTSIGGFTGSLQGTSSWASNATTASYIATASSATSASFTATASLATTASFAATASNVLGGAVGYVSFWNTATALSSSVIYQTSSNIGVGTLIPSYSLDVSSSFRTFGNIAATSGSAYFIVSQSINQPAQTGSQIIDVNITPTFAYNAPNQTQTALKVAATFSGSVAISSSQTNIIADLGATSVGSQFIVTDVTSGSIYQVNDVSGLPIIEANSNWDVFIYDYPNTVFKKTGSVIELGVLANTSSYTQFKADLVINEGLGVTFRQGQVTGSTSGATTASLYNIVFTNTSSSVYMHAVVTGYETGSRNTITGDVKATIRYAAGTASLVGWNQSFMNTNDNVVSFDIVAGSTSGSLLAYGTGSKVYQWGATVTTQII